MKTNRPLYSFVLVAGSLAFGAGAARADYQSAVLSDGPVAYYRFSEAGVVAAAYPAFSNLGTNGAAAAGAASVTVTNNNTRLVLGVPGALNDLVNTAVSFPGQNGFNQIIVPYQAALNPNGPFSVELWLKGGIIFSCPAVASDLASGWLFYQSSASQASGNGWTFRLYQTSGSFSLQVNMPVDTNRWYHIVGVYDGTRSLVYTNGVLAASGTLSGTFKANTTQPVRFGGRAGSGTLYAYDGQMDEPAIYTYALTPAQVAAHYAAAITNGTAYATQILAGSPAGYWRFNESMAVLVAKNSGSAGSALDAIYYYWSSTAADLQAPTYGGLETTNTVLQLSGTNGCVTIPPPNFNINTLTIEFWIKLNAVQSNWAGVVFWRNANSGGANSGLNLDGNFGVTPPPLGYFWNNSQQTFNSELYPPLNQWVYVALAVGPSSASIYLYDGTNWLGATNVASHAAVSFSTVPLLIGQDTGTSTRFFNGSMDEVAIYTKTLTEAQLRNHALAGFANDTNAPVLLTDPPAQTPDQLFAGAPFTLTVDAYGSGTSYQWQLGDGTTQTNIPGATSRSYAKAYATDLDAGLYDVIISNAYGAITSSMIHVFIYAPNVLNVDTPPASRSVYPNGNVTLTAVVSGTAPVYQWQHAGTNLPGATAASLTLVNIDATKMGEYVIIATNLASSVTSTPPALVSLIAADANSYVGNVVADAPEAYWRLDEASGPSVRDSMGRHDGTAIGGIISFSEPGALAGDTDTCIVFAAGSGEGVRVPYSAELNTPPFSIECWGYLYGTSTSTLYAPIGSRDATGDVLSPRRGYNLYANSTATKWVFWTGNNTFWQTTVSPGVVVHSNWTHLVCTTDGFTDQLYVNGVLAARTDATFFKNVVKSFYIGSLGPTDGAAGWSGPIDEVAFYKSILPPARIATHFGLGAYGTNAQPVFLTPPASQTAQFGTTVAFNPTLVGAIPMTYQWKQNGTSLASGTDLALSFTSVDYTNAGQYTLAVTNSYGGIVSSAAALVVAPPPSVTNLTSRISYTATGPKLELIWPLGYALYYTTNLITGTWLPVSGATAPYYNVPISPATEKMFFKIQ